ncbi:hypothetical protein BJI49_10125 [Acetobacter pasteurianus]|nr:hypothetical protein AZ09_14090 [Acetobacter aceti 1023]RCL04204.1 hypothetical protein BBA71_14185 [Acetobacter pasteurianus]RCL05622.1 hypothetical protein BJI49_10125 [Acetobacter pasteurianus]
MPKRAEFPFRDAGVGPEVIPGQVDMLPPQRREMLEQIRRNGSSLTFEMPHCGSEIGGVPQYDGAGDEIERARPMSLGLQSVIADPAGAMEKDGALEGVLGLSLVQLAGGAAAFFGELDPVI